MQEWLENVTALVADFKLSDLRQRRTGSESEQVCVH